MPAGTFAAGGATLPEPVRWEFSAGTASAVSPYEAGAYTVFHPPRRTDAVVLAALADAGELPELRSAIARGLMVHRLRGRWANTQENALAVAALSRFLAVDEATEPDFIARVWAGPRLATQSSCDEPPKSSAPECALRKLDSPPTM